MVTVRAVKTGTIRIRPSHRAGNNNLPVWRRRLAILLDRRWTPLLPIYTYLIEHDEGLILVDSGESACSTARGYFSWWSPFFQLALDFHVEPEDQIGPRLRSMGIDPGKDLQMQSRFLVGGMAAVPEGAGTRFAFLGGLRLPGMKLLGPLLRPAVTKLALRPIRRVGTSAPGPLTTPRH
jgi:hypothetical protein